MRDGSRWLLTGSVVMTEPFLSPVLRLTSAAAATVMAPEIVTISIDTVDDGEDRAVFGIKPRRPPAMQSAGVDGAGSHLRPRHETTRMSRLVLFSRRPPSSVTVTMSSIRTPKRPGR
jgi:hypothetical protein